MMPIDISSDKRILVVAPHPDDECIGAGGILSRYSKQTDVLLLTDGSRYNLRNRLEQNILVRKQEFISEMIDAGINQYFLLGLPDGEITANMNAVKKFDFSPYNMIFVTSHSDKHPDHRAAYIGVIEALKEQKVDALLYEYEVWTPLAYVTDYLDISMCIEEKISLIGWHKSQLLEHDYQRMARSLNEYRGTQSKVCMYAEAYCKVDIYSDMVSSEQKRNNEQIQKYQLLYHVCGKFLKINTNGNSVPDYIKDHGWLNIAIYGYSYLGKSLYDTIKNQVRVAYILDKRASKLTEEEISIKNPEEEGLEPVDIIIVTAVFAYEEIKQNLESKGFKTVSLTRILEEISGLGE